MIEIHEDNKRASIIGHLPTAKFLTNRLNHWTWFEQRNYPRIRKIEERKIRRNVHFSQHKFHCFHFIRLSEREREEKRKTKLAPNSIIAQHATRWRLAAVQSGDCARRCCGTDGCVASLTRGRAIVCGLVLPIRQRLSTPKAPLSLSLSVYLSILPHHVDVI